MKASHSAKSIAPQCQRSKQNIRIDRARFSDIEPIVKLLASAGPECLPVDALEVSLQLANFRVIRNEADRVIATCSARCIRDNLFELRSVFVEKSHRGLGLAKILIRDFVARAKQQGWQLACVTCNPDFFSSLGFSPTKSDLLPEKKGLRRELLATRRITMIHVQDHSSQLNLKRMLA